MANKDRSKQFGRLRVKVTEEDIEKAQLKNSFKCVVAQAIARTLPDATRIDVDTQAIRFTQDGRRRVYLTPYSVQGYVVAFDAGETIEPFNFELDDRRSIEVQRSQVTEAGRAKQAARNRVKAAERRKARTEVAVQEDRETPRQLARAEQAVVEAETELAAVKLAYAGQVESEKVGEGRRTGPPRVYKKTERSYGMRQLRINQR